MNKKFVEKFKENILSIILCNIIELREEFAKNENLFPEKVFDSAELFKNLYYNLLEK